MSKLNVTDIDMMLYVLGLYQFQIEVYKKLDYPLNKEIEALEQMKHAPMAFLVDTLSEDEGIKLLQTKNGACLAWILHQIETSEIMQQLQADVKDLISTDEEAR